MAEEELQELQLLDGLFHEFSNIDIERDLVRAADLGTTINFARARELFERVVSYVKPLESLPWKDLPLQLVKGVVGSAQSVKSSLDAIKAFSVEEGNASARRDSLVSNLEVAFEAFRVATVPHIGYLSYQTLDLPEVKREVDQVVEDARVKSAQILDEIKGELQTRRTEAEEILKALREASAEAGVSVHAEAFKEAADGHEKQARNWLAVSLLAALATVGGVFALVELWEVHGDISQASVLQIVLAKGAFLAVFAFVTLTFFRLYRVQVHLAVTNRHRELALRTFRSFVEASEDVGTKDKVLLEATHAVFGQTSTGLVDGHEPSVLELLDAAGATSLLRRG